MSIHSQLRGAAAMAFALTVAGTAFARKPPALTERQEATDRVLSTCDEGAASTSGYRDMLVRLDPQTSQPVSRASARPRVIVQRMGDHTVMLCPGGWVHGPGGYRDLDRRFNVERPQTQIAKATFSGESRRVR